MLPILYAIILFADSGDYPAAIRPSSELELRSRSPLPRYSDTAPAILSSRNVTGYTLGEYLLFDTSPCFFCRLANALLVDWGWMEWLTPGGTFELLLFGADMI